MKFGYAEIFLIFAGVISFQSLTWGLSLAGISLFIAFCRFALQVQEKKVAKENAEQAATILNEQVGELAENLGKLFKGVQKSPIKKNKKYNPDLH
tara:strand:+ start:2355 stop:2639 length:285 start_codon:yes stop_codon:yes gene_type:complete